jgi:hypothetical protein
MNSWRDADVVFLFDQFYLPKTVAVATVQGLRGHRADEGDLASMTTIRSKPPGVRIISSGHSLRWLKNSHCADAAGPMTRAATAASSDR